MLANHLGFEVAGRIATLSNSYVVHCNVNEAVMEYGEDQWWIQEWNFPRAGAGRGLHVSKIWSPKGVHVATAYQDGLCVAEVPSRLTEREKL